MIASRTRLETLRLFGTSNQIGSVTPVGVGFSADATAEVAADIERTGEEHTDRRFARAIA